MSEGEGEKRREEKGRQERSSTKQFLFTEVSKPISAGTEIFFPSSSRSRAREIVSLNGTFALQYISFAIPHRDLRKLLVGASSSLCPLLFFPFLLSIYTLSCFFLFFFSFNLLKSLSYIRKSFGAREGKGHVSSWPEKRTQKIRSQLIVAPGIVGRRGASGLPAPPARLPPRETWG